MDPIVLERRSDAAKIILSGKYRQTSLFLRLGNSYCFAGMLCDLSGVGKWEKEMKESSGKYSYAYIADEQKRVHDMPDAVSVYYGIESGSYWTSQGDEKVGKEPLASLVDRFIHEDEYLERESARRKAMGKALARRMGNSDNGQLG